MSAEQNNGLDFVLSEPAPAPAAAGAYGGATPIADLTYRNYDGPLNTHRFRWWIVALNTLRLAKAKKGFWISAAISLLPYLVVVVSLYIASLAPAAQGINPLDMSAPGQKYAYQFFQALSNQKFFLFILALMVGSGSIALDNRSNALMVYLSKPITKGDYLIGKWMGIFIALFTVAFVPSLLLFLYCVFSYWSAGFLKNEGWLFFKIILACAVPAALHASLILGFSAWSKTPRMAGAIYAGVYFVGLFVSTATWGIMTRGNLAEGVLVRHLSIPGLIDGLAQNALRVDFLMTVRNRTTGMQQLTIHPPSLTAMLLIGFGLCVLGLAAARARIRAVEVVKG